MAKQNQDSSSNYSTLNCLKPRFLFLLALSSVAKAYNLGNLNDGIREYRVISPVVQNQNGFFSCIGTHCGHTVANKPDQEPLIGSTCINDGYGRVVCK
jgi:hypothetical protein